MEVDLIKSSEEDEDAMEMMTMMMQLDKFPELFSGPYDSASQLPEIEFSGGSATSIETTPPLFHNVPHVVNQSIPLIMSSSTTPAQEPMTPPKFRSETSEPSSLEKRNSMEAMREMIFGIAVMQPIQIDPESVKPPKRRNVKISKDPQSVAARHRRERISERIRILQRLVPGATKMDTASMLDEAIHYMKFLKKQVQSLQRNGPMGFGFPNMNYSSLLKPCQPSQMVGSMQMLR